ncbi:MAG: metalloregulator ArsR/SmtB family transcription factor [Caulobacter sp.]|nr:metalloregulator ArsR/SmtB family transcription factor [Caulobacter sp.]
MSDPRPPTHEALRHLEDRAAGAARMMKLLANEQRLRILCRLIDREASAGDLARHAGLAQSAASQHLARMRSEGLVATRREGQTIYYRMAAPEAARMVDTLCAIFRPPEPAGDTPGGSDGGD